MTLIGQTVNNVSLTRCLCCVSFLFPVGGAERTTHSPPLPVSSKDFHPYLEDFPLPPVITQKMVNTLTIQYIYHYTNLTFVCPSVSPGGHGKPFDPS